MASSHKVLLPEKWIKRSEEYGVGVVEAYPREPAMQRSRSVASRDAESNPELQALSKMAEVAFCLWCELDPDTALKWTVGVPDAGVDIIVKGLRWDVKHTPHPRGDCILWPERKAYFFEEKKVDAYVLVRGIGPEFEIVRWITKKTFRERMKIAEPGNSYRFDPGTLYVEAADCREMWPDPHHCLCGEWGAFGFGVSLRNGRFGDWFCLEHRTLGQRVSAASLFDEASSSAA